MIYSTVKEKAGEGVTREGRGDGRCKVVKFNYYSYNTAVCSPYLFMIHPIVIEEVKLMTRGE